MATEHLCQLQVTAGAHSGYKAIMSVTPPGNQDLRASRLGIADVSLHPLYIDLSLYFRRHLLVHVDVHDVFGDRLRRVSGGMT